MNRKPENLQEWLLKVIAYALMLTLAAILLNVIIGCSTAPDASETHKTAQHETLITTPSKGTGYCANGEAWAIKYHLPQCL